MGFRVGDRVRTKRDIAGGFIFGPDAVRKGQPGTVYKISGWSSKYSVRFDNGAKREDLTDEDIERK
jgi:hypothetical protein